MRPLESNVILPPLTAHLGLSSYPFHSHMLFLILFSGIIYLELWLA